MSLSAIRAGPPERAVDFFSIPLSAISDAAREAVILVDPQQVILTANAAATRVFGCTEADLAGQPLERLIPARYRAEHSVRFRAFDASGQPELPMNREPIQCLRWNGEEFPAAVSLSRIALTPGSAGPRHCFVVVLCDLSVERQLRAEVAALTERFRMLLDLSPLAMWIIEDDHVAYVNHAALALFGVIQADRLVGKPLGDLFHPDSREAVATQVRRALDVASPPPVMGGGIVQAGGERRDVEIACAALPDSRRTVLQMVVTDVTQRQAQTREQMEHRAALRRLAANVVEAREEERRRISRELHDELGQRLSALKLELSGLRPAGARQPADARITGMLEMVDDTVAAVRRIAADLRPLMLDDLGLNAAIEALARDVTRRMGIDVTVRLGDDDPPVDDGTAIAIYRMVQEALTNVGRHSQATEAHVELLPEQDELLLSVRDNGIGFPERSLHQEGRFGLLGIRERAIMLGGRLDVDNPPGGGGRIVVHLPLKPPAFDAVQPS